MAGSVCRGLVRRVLADGKQGTCSSLAICWVGLNLLFPWVQKGLGMSIPQVSQAMAELMSLTQLSLGALISLKTTSPVVPHGVHRVS